MLTLIAAVARNGVIGGDNRLLWQLPEDLRFFKAATQGGTVVMGRKTWQSLPAAARPLPGRRNLVLTRDAAFGAPGAEAVPDLDAALQRLPREAEVFVIGGAEIYAQALPRARRLLLTELDRDFEGDAYFPPWPREDFIAVSRTHHDSGQGFGYIRTDYRRP